MNFRILASLLAAAALFGSLPAWWLIHEHAARQEATPTNPPQDDSSESTAGTPSAATTPSPSEEPPVPNSVGEPAAVSRPEKTQPELVTAPDAGRSPLADRLNSPEGTIADDLEIVRRVLNNFLLELGTTPVGSNREITAQLTGRNSRHHKPLPHDTPAINSDGELTDRWGTPFFFHALSAREMEVRSAGPDRELYTEDDTVWSPVPKAEASPTAPPATSPQPETAPSNEES